MRLLVVDDSFTMRRLLIRALRMGGLEFSDVKEAGDGLEALAAVGKDPPELIICDINMPKLDGLKFLAALRKLYNSSQCKIVMLTAKAAKATEEAARKAGADGFLAKPFVAEEIAQQIHQIIHGRPK
ncbi:MAG: response regulator [Deltaproteobacteria bacterium]|nr:response regulator [Deltaproteobacteria bacterium]